MGLGFQGLGSQLLGKFGGPGLFFEGGGSRKLICPGLLFLLLRFFIPGFDASVC